MHFDNDEVFNNVVEIKRVERTIVIDEDKVQALFERKSRVPSNVVMGITLKFNKFLPPRDDKESFSTYFMRRPLYSTNVLCSDQNENIKRLEEAEKVIN